MVLCSIPRSLHCYCDELDDQGRRQRGEKNQTRDQGTSDRSYNYTQLSQFKAERFVRNRTFRCHIFGMSH